MHEAMKDMKESGLLIGTLPARATYERNKAKMHKTLAGTILARLIISCSASNIAIRDSIMQSDESRSYIH